MAVAIVTCRDVKPEYQEEAFDLLKQLRAMALMQRGYLSGETLFSAERSGRHLIISRWRSLADWERWRHQPARMEIVAQVDRLLDGPATSEVYLEAPPWMPEPVP